MWLIDPLTMKKSVSLTILTLATLCLVAACWSQMKDIGAFERFFWSAQALYFGRRISFGKAVF